MALSCMFAYCYLGNVVTAKCIEIGDAAYQSLWYRYPLFAQQYIIFVLRFTQRPFYFSGFGLMRCSLESFTSVIIIILLFGRTRWRQFIQYSHTYTRMQLLFEFFFSINIFAIVLCPHCCHICDCMHSSSKCSYRVLLLFSTRHAAQIIGFRLKFAFSPKKINKMKLSKYVDWMQAIHFNGLCICS